MSSSVIVGTKKLILKILLQILHKKMKPLKEFGKFLLLWLAVSWMMLVWTKILKISFEPGFLRQKHDLAFSPRQNSYEMMYNEKPNLSFVNSFWFWLCAFWHIEKPLQKIRSNLKKGNLVANSDNSKSYLVVFEDEKG